MAVEGGPGNGFGLGFRVVIDPVRAGSPGSVGEYNWGGAASTYFWVDPANQLVGVVMTQFLATYLPLRDDMRTAVYATIPSR